MTANVQVVVVTAVVDAAGAAAGADACIDACTDAGVNIVVGPPTVVVAGIARLRDVVDLLGRSYRAVVLVVALRCLRPPSSRPGADRVRPGRCVHKGPAVHSCDNRCFQYPQL